MNQRDNREVSLEALQRMIAYVREEALRLRIMDVAMLLEHAGDAVAAFGPAPLGGAGRAASIHKASCVEH